MKIAVVILNWNGLALLKQFLPSVVDFSKEADIYVADNASTDNSVNYLKTHYPNIKIIQNQTNSGYALGYNNALKQIDAPIFCLLNNDVAVTENWLKPVIAHFKTHPKTAIIQPKILDYKKQTHFEYAGAAGGFIDKYAFPYCRGRIFNSIEADLGQYNSNAEIFWASGACFFIRREVFNTLQGFDASFFAHMEEIDLCWRAKNMGYKIMYIWESCIYHVGGASLSHNNPQKTYLNFKNSLTTLTKNAKGIVCLFVFTRLIIDGIAGLKFLFNGKPLHTLAILKAHINFYLNLPTTLKQRKEIYPKLKYYKIKSIVWRYYLKGKKNYS